MLRRILIIDGHPDARPERYLHALAAAYRDGATSRGHSARTLSVSALSFPLLRTGDEFLSGTPPGAIQAAQRQLAWAQHVVILFPLWLGSMPALLKAFLEQTLRPGFAFAPATRRGFPRKLLTGKSARVIVTMGMPGFFYRWYFRAHSLKSLERNILGFCGFSPVRSSVIGTVESMGQAGRRAWLARVRKLGEQAR